MMSIVFATILLHLLLLHEVQSNDLATVATLQPDVEFTHSGILVMHASEVIDRLGLYNETGDELFIYEVAKKNNLIEIYVNATIYVEDFASARDLAATKCSFTVTADCPGWPTGVTKLDTRVCKFGSSDCTGWVANTGATRDVESGAVVSADRFTMAAQCQRYSGVLGRTLRTTLISSGGTRTASQYSGSWGRITHRWIITCSYWGPGWS